MSVLNTLIALGKKLAFKNLKSQVSSILQDTPKRPTSTKIKPGEYPGDHTGPFTITYAPHAGSLPDPGEVVWTWVPFEEDYSQGKDRPVLIMGRERQWLLGVMLSSQNHNLDKEQEARCNRFWHEIGQGPWDEDGHSSFARVNRIIRVKTGKVRRIGGRLDEKRFRKVARAVEQYF